MKSPAVKLLLLLCCAGALPGAHAQNINTPAKTGPLGTKVNTLTGNLFVPRNDVFANARGFDIGVTFYYNSFNFNVNTGFGNGWGLGYAVKYTTDTANNKTIVWGDGREDTYTALPGGGFKAPNGFYTTLAEYQAGKFLLTEPAGTRYYFDNGINHRITKMQDPNGNYTGFNYTDTLLTSIVNNVGQNISLTYDAKGNLATVVDAIASPSRTWTYTYDGNNNLVQVTDPLGGSDKYTYLINGPMKTLADKNSNTVDIIYYGDFTVSEIIGCNKRQSYSYDTTNQVTLVTDYVPTGTNQVTKYGYKKFGDLSWLTSLTSNCCGYNMTFEFDANGNKTKQTDANGNITTYTYDNRGNMLTLTDALGQTLTYTYSTDFNNVTSFTDAKGFVTTMTYNSTGNLVQLADPGNLLYTATYNANGDIISSTDPKGNTFIYNYDSYGNATTVTGPDGYSAVLASDARGNLVSYTDARGNASSMEYDILNRLKKVTDPLSNKVQLGYDAEGNMTTVVNQDNETSRFKYDASNRMVQFTNPINNITTVSYDAMDNPIEVKDALNNTITYTYDSRNRLTNVKDAAGNNSNISYDAKGNILAAQLPGGQQLNYTYDKLDRVTGMSDITGTIMGLVYDKNDNVTSFTNATGAISTAVYDSLDRIKQVADPLGNTALFGYDKNSNITAITDRNGNTRTLTYDGLDRLKTYTDNNGGVTTLTYDNAGNPVSMKDQNNNVTSYTFDNLNRVKTIAYPDGRTVQYTYDSRGNVVAKKLADGSSITYVYDSLSRIISKILPGGQTTAYTYDALNRVVAAANAAGTVAVTYDALSRVTSETFDGHTTKYSYDIAGRKQTTIYPDSTVIYKTFDTRNRLTSISKGNTLLVTYQYNNANQVTSKVFGNGVTTNLQYDFANRLSNLSTGNGSVQNTAYTYDKERNKNSVNRLNDAALSETYGFDNNYRITSYKRGVIGGSATLQNSYTYDALGNRTAATLNGVATTYSVNNLNQLTGSNSSSGNVVFQYDNNGNLTYDGHFYKTYDAEGHLLKDSAAPASVITYQYDAIGRRVQKAINGFPLKYTYSGLEQIEERDGITNALRSRTIFNGFLSPVVNEKDNNAYYYHQNEQNSIEAITNSAGAITEKYQYDVYGKQTMYDGSNAVITSSIAGNRFGFTGQEFDSATNSLRFYYRNYNPETGTFNQRDLIGYADGTGMYQYVHNNPANGIDIFGLDDCPKDKTLIDNIDSDESWANGIGSWTELLAKIKQLRNLKAMQRYQHDLDVMMEVLENQFMGKEAGQLFKQWENVTQNIKNIDNTKLANSLKGLKALGNVLNALDFGVKTYKLEQAVSDYLDGKGDFLQAEKAGGNAVQSALGFTPVGAAYNLFDFAQEKLISGRSMNDNAELAGQVFGENDVNTSQEEEEAEFHRQRGDFEKWWKIRRRQNMENARRNKPKPNCPQNNDPRGTRKPPPPGFVGPIKPVEFISSTDPNEIIGPDGQPSKKWVSVKDRLPYTILFENDKSASAPAKYVRVITPIEPKQDAATFELSSFGFNNQTFAIPAGTASTYQRLDCKDSLGLYVDITAGYDQLTNQAFWDFQCIDPVTLLPPTDPLKGFLLRQDSLHTNFGHAFVNFSIKPVTAAVTLDTIGARANIVFDSNDTIPTNIATNTIDAFAPTSHMNTLPATSSNPVALSWGGVDDLHGCGVWYYTLYASMDGVNFSMIKTKITRTDTTFVGIPNNTYYFFVLATDSVGNTEVLRPGEVRSTFIGGTPLPITWLYFKGTTQNKDNLLEWATATEQNSKEFKVERSLDGSSFNTIGAVAAAGNSSTTTNYHYTDFGIDKLNSTVMYYRLKQFDINGSFKYSNIVRLTYNQKDIVNSLVYPNPTQGVITITVGDKALVGTNAVLIDENGRTLETIKITASSQSINMARYVNGVYFIRLNNKEVLKIVKM